MTKNTSTTSKQQTSLDSFFGSGNTSKQQSTTKGGGSKQKKIEAFFSTTATSKSNTIAKPSASDTKEVEKQTTIKEPDVTKGGKKSVDNDLVLKNNATSTNPTSPAEVSTTSTSTVSNGNNNRMDDDDDDEQNVNINTSSRRIHHDTNKKTKRRRVVIDDDDDEEEDEDVNDNDKNKSTLPIPSQPIRSTKENRKDDKVDTIMTEKETKDEIISPSRSKKNKIGTSNEKVNSNANADDIDTKQGVQIKSNKISGEENISKSSNSSNEKKESKNKKIELKQSIVHKNVSKKDDSKASNTDDTVMNDGGISNNTWKGLYKSDQDILTELTTTTTRWEDHTPIPYSIICSTFYQIECITSRLAIQELMTTLIRQIILKHTMNHNNSGSTDPSTTTSNTSGVQRDLQAVLYLASNTVAPAYECIELGIGDALLMKAIGQATGTNTNMIKQKYESLGDLGTVAQTYKGKQSTLGGFFSKSTTTTNNNNTKANKNALSAQEVWLAFQQIAKTKGNNSQQWKVDIIKKMLVRTTDPLETKYIIRGLQGKLRIGLSQATVLIAFAHAFTLTKPVVSTLSNISSNNENDHDTTPDEARQYMDPSQPIEKVLEAATAIVKRAYSEVPSYDSIIDAGLKVQLQDFYRVCTLTPGIPVTPMLAKPTKSVQEVLKRLNGLKFTCEYKYDGERAQIHMLPNGTTKVFSRNLLDTSEKYPEVPIFVKEACSTLPSTNVNVTDDKTQDAMESNVVTSFVLDAEVVAWNSKTEQFVPFQILSTRKKTEESAETAKVQVIVQAFDLMYLNGQSLLHHTLSDRRALMHKYFQPVTGKFQFAQHLDHVENGDTIVLEEFLENAVKAQCEGLMVKTLDVNAIYEPSRRSLNWLKLKKDYLEGLGDSVDLVPLGAYHGRGKRTGVYGAYLLACYDPDTEEYQSVCKIGTGFSDENLRTLSEQLNKHIIPAKSSQYKVSDQLECDVWFDAVHVWEVKAADLSKSSTHRGAEGKTGEVGRGIGLRFPRFERIRDDKRPDAATTSDQILEMYYQQDSIVDSGMNDELDDDDGI